MFEWIPSCSLPVDRESVLVFCPDESEPKQTGYWDARDEVWRNTRGEVLDQPTHWAYLPEDPDL